MAAVALARSARLSRIGQRKGCGLTRCGAMLLTSNPRSRIDSATKPKSQRYRYRSPPTTRRDVLPEAPAAQSWASITAVFSPRDAASSATPAPVTPPPITTTSKSSLASAFKCCWRCAGFRRLPIGTSWSGVWTSLHCLRWRCFMPLLVPSLPVSRLLREIANHSSWTVTEQIFCMHRPVPLTDARSTKPTLTGEDRPAAPKSGLTGDGLVGLPRVDRPAVGARGSASMLTTVDQTVFVSLDWTPDMARVSDHRAFPMTIGHYLPIYRRSYIGPDSGLRAKAESRGAGIARSATVLGLR